MAALWLLNLDAELEWAARRRGPSYAATREVRSILARARHLLPGLWAPGDELLEGAFSGRAASGSWVGRAFCPTPAAERCFADIGLPTELWPDLALVEAVNDRSFAFEHGLGPSASMRWMGERALRDYLLHQECGQVWQAKRALGTAGRGQRVLRSGELTLADQSWLRASLLIGAVFLEPRRRILAEYSLHGRLHPGGALLRGQPMRFVAQGGAFQSASLVASEDLDAAAKAQLEAALERAACELHAVGYFGPFGIDAYRWEADGQVHFEACSEINARYTLAWAQGMQIAGPEALRPYSLESDECSSDAELMQ